MRKYAVEIKIIVLITFAVIAVFAAGYLAYNSINFILSTIKKGAQPNYSLLILKEINSNLQRGESQVEYYNLTNDKKYLQSYNEVISIVENRIDSLVVYSRGNSLREAQIDTISTLLNQKFRIWQVMIKQSNDDRLEDALTKLSNVFEVVPDSMTLQVPKSVTVEVPDTTNIQLEAESQDEKEGFFSRLFKKKPEPIPIESPQKIDSIIVEEIIESKDTLIAVGVDKTIIKSEIGRLKEQVGEQMRESTAFEITLKHKNSQVTNQLANLISRIESEELESIKEKAQEANRLVRITNRWSMVFLIMFFILLIGVVYVIQRYIRKTSAIQIALTNAKNAALKLSQTKQQFLANMSHEIRTPMNAIVGFTEQILQMPIEGQSREQLEIVKSSADHLLNLINDILDFSKLEAGKVMLDYYPFNVKELFYQAYQLYKPSADLKNVRFKVDLNKNVPNVLVGDSFRLRQIVFNLLSNAIKFTDKGQVIVYAKSKKLKQNKVKLIIEVKDSGIGIPVEKLKSIFEEFTQADISISRSYGGTGLGLSIVRKLVNLHEGKISVENVKEGGACFIVEIQYAIGDEKDIVKEEKMQSPNSIDLSEFHFIIADDDEYNRKLIQHILEKWKLNFTIVQNGEEVLKAIEKKEYHLLLLDIHMPGMNGFEVAKRIRSSKNSKIRKLPIVALTATVEKEEQKKSSEVGINDLLSKPYTEAELYSKLTEILKIDKVRGKKNIKVLKPQLRTTEKEETMSEFDDLYSLSNNDKAFVEDMLQMFVVNTKKDLINIKSAFTKKNWKELAELAHKIKAPCKHLDAKELSVLLKQLELTAREGTNEALITELHEKSLNGVDLLIEKVNNHLKNNFA
jgi:signal transduction histidine kinase/DNA-binding response OmpR family regulator